jgi:hypothetical protein
MVLAANNDENIPNMRIAGSSWYNLMSIIFDRIVPVTDAPRKNAPENSHTDAITEIEIMDVEQSERTSIQTVTNLHERISMNLLTACFKVIDREEMDDANALATSLAPIRKPYTKPRIPPRTAIQRYSRSGSAMVISSWMRKVQKRVEKKSRCLFREKIFFMAGKGGCQKLHNVLRDAKRNRTSNIANSEQKNGW